MGSLSCGVYRLFVRLRLQWQSRFNRIAFSVSGQASLSQLSLGPGCRFNVPVRTGGLGQLEIGPSNSFGYGLAPFQGDGSLLLQPRARRARLAIGANNSFSNNVAIIANQSISIGNRCLIGDLVAIYDSDFHHLDPSSRWESGASTEPVSIEDNVWLGSRSMVLKGVTIGRNSVIGAMSLVTRSVPPNSIAVGIPARVVRELKPPCQSTG